MHRYKECGLPNVWLENGYKVKQTPYGEIVSVPNADSLLRVLANNLACKKSRFTGRELWFIRTVLCLSQKNLARLLGTTEESLSLWEKNGRMPKAGEALARALTLEHLGSTSLLSSSEPDP
jgi:DNA-binding transcriptional regulator YiaG